MSPRDDPTAGTASRVIRLQDQHRDDPPPGPDRRKPADQAYDAVVGGRGNELWLSAEGDPWISFQTKGHREHWPIDSREVRDLVGHTYFRIKGTTLSRQSRSDTIDHLKERARYLGKTHDVYLRLADVEGAIWLDLADDAWRAVRVTAAGWEVIATPPVRFRRPRGMLALPDPEKGGSVERLRPYLNAASDEDWVMIKAFIIAAMRPSGPYPILELQGGAGTAKSTTTRVIRALVDPAKAPLRSLPSTSRDLMISASNSWLLCFDNASGVSPALSDDLCRLSTGGGLATRKLYTDADETILDATRPVILNGIDQVSRRGDLVQRLIPISLPTIGEEGRRDETSLWREFEAERPQIFGALLDGLLGALRRFPATTLDRLPRMADFARWVVAAAPGLGFTEAEFLAAYTGNRVAAHQPTLAASPITDALIALANQQGGWTGTATTLLQAVTDLVLDERIRRQRGFPHTPAEMGKELRRLIPSLREGAAVEVGERKVGHDRLREISLRVASPPPSAPSAPSALSAMVGARGGGSAGAPIPGTVQLAAAIPPLPSADGADGADTGLGLK
jgi:hypothetical protein